MKSNKVTSFFLLLMFLLLQTYNATCQLSVPGQPASTIYNLPQDNKGVIYLSQPDLTLTVQEDEQYPSPYRFGIVMNVDVSPGYTGNWYVLNDGVEIWRATVSAPGAVALSAYFDRFHIPEGGELYIYDMDKTRILGAFTSMNNSESGLFSTELIPGSDMTLEYVKPTGSGLPLIHMNEITYAYRGIGFSYGETDNPERSGKCEVNVICPEGDNWQSQKKGVTKIHVKRGGGTYWCTGSLINNTNLDNEPYILTANHCGFNSSEKELKQWVFYFDYESSECASPVYPPVKALIGATLKAHSGKQQTSGSDFYLVRLEQELPDTFHVFFNGWSRSAEPGNSGVGIHHPGGDLKKISTFNSPLESVTWMGGSAETHWSVVWVKTISGHGVTEPGSSGSPLFDSQGRIIGILSSGESSCDSAYINLPDYYGKFYWSWASDGNDSISRLMYWLDPLGTNLFFLDGRYTNSIDTITPSIQSIFPNPFEDQLTVNITDIRNRQVEVYVYDIFSRMIYSASYLVGDNGNLQVNLGFLSSGLYILKMESKDAIITSKIVRQ